MARVQFAFTIAFHCIYLPLSIGLGLLMVIFEGMFIKTGDKQYETLARFWTKIFALTFGIGVATGIVMEFEFGTKWQPTPSTSATSSAVPGLNQATYKFDGSGFTL